MKVQTKDYRLYYQFNSCFFIMREAHCAINPDFFLIIKKKHLGVNNVKLVFPKKVKFDAQGVSVISSQITKLTWLLSYYTLQHIEYFRYDLIFDIKRKWISTQL